MVSFVWSHSRVFTKDSNSSGVVRTGIPNSSDFLRIWYSTDLCQYRSVKKLLNPDSKRLVEGYNNYKEIQACKQVWEADPF